MVNPRLTELQTAKLILEEIFDTRPYDIEEMIQMRLEGRTRANFISVLRWRL
jgi:hypothetical protein